ncbi:hypothetical protein ANO11243_053180 [Dothideomycetidae sp. 11243]|nr:hypothetical protein ANO11243_053180 [fungal sp. No.11243]
MVRIERLRAETRRVKSEEKEKERRRTSHPTHTRRGRVDGGGMGTQLRRVTPNNNGRLRAMGTTRRHRNKAERHKSRGQHRRAIGRDWLPTATVEGPNLVFVRPLGVLDWATSNTSHPQLKPPPQASDAAPISLAQPSGNPLAASCSATLLSQGRAVGDKFLSPLAG